ncbi:hypothetical protein JCM10212_003433 [Sporobolomyces blumeae]
MAPNRGSTGSSVVSPSPAPPAVPISSHSRAGSPASAGFASSSSNARLSGTSSRLSIRVPDNEPFIARELDGRMGARDSRGKGRAAVDERGRVAVGRELGLVFDLSDGRDGVLEGGAAHGRSDGGPLTGLAIATTPASTVADLEPPCQTPVSLPSSASRSRLLPQHGEARSRVDSSNSSDLFQRDSIPSSCSYSDDHTADLLGYSASRHMGSTGMPVRSLEEIRAAEAEEDERGEDAARWKEEQRRLAAEALNGTRTSGSAQTTPTRDATTSSSARRPHPQSNPSETSDSSLSNSLGPSSASIATASDSSSPNLPVESPVDLTLPNRPNGPFVSVATGPLAQLSANHLPEPRPQSRGPRSFFTNLLNRSPRSSHVSPRFSSSPPLPSSAQLSPNPSAPSSHLSGVNQARSPRLDAVRSASDNHHNRSSSLPSSPVAPVSARHSAEIPSRSRMPDVDRSPPRLSRTFAGLGRSVSMRNAPATPSNAAAKTPSRPISSSHLPAPPASRPAASSAPTSPRLGAERASPSPPVATLASIGVSLVSITPPLSISRNSQPLCGAVLDDKYLLIGTSTGLDFLPLPLPGSLPMPQLGSKRRKEVRKPMALIKRTRFKELAVLSERSNILLAIAGRNDHIRVYALDGIRAMIEKKMSEVNLRDGYPFIQDSAVLRLGTNKSATASAKGKGRALPSPSPSSTSALAPPQRTSAFPSQLEPYRFPVTSPPPAYDAGPGHSLSARRRPSSVRLTSGTSMTGVSPTARSFSRNNSIASGSLVRAVPTNPRGSVSSQSTAVPSTPRSVRRQGSRPEFVVSRKGSSATIVRRKSRIDVGASSTARTKSIASSRRSSVNGIDGPASASSRLRSKSTPNAHAQARFPDDVAEESDSGRRSSVPLSAFGSSPSFSPSSRRFAQETWPASDSPKADLPEEVGSKDPGAPPDVVPATFFNRLDSSGVDEPILSNPFRGDVQDENEPPRSASTVSGRTFRSGRYQARAPTSRSLAPDERSATLELADMIRDTGPSGPSTAAPSNLSRSPSQHLSPTSSRRPSAEARPVPRHASTPKLGQGQKSPSMELAALLKETGPGDSSSSSHQLSHSNDRRRSNGDRLVARSPFATPVADSSDDGSDASPSAARRKGQTLIEAISSGPLTVGENAGLGIMAPDEAESEATNGRTGSSRINKRWTMGGMSSLLSRSSPSTSTADDQSASRIDRPSSLRPARPASTRPRASIETARSAEQWETVSQSEPLAQPAVPLMTGRGGEVPIDGKRRPRPSLHPPETPTIPQSSQVPPDTHSAHQTSALEYVKLARTRGARSFKAVETKKRTYLAVLCGEEGERIELFTGSRNISLSLNRTFVLPETPRAIDFQLQGDDLVDIYLIYPESIFALEPATVRVREVGVGRSERRARRERERAAQAGEGVGSNASATPEDEPPLTAGVNSSMHPADHERPDDDGRPATGARSIGIENNIRIDEVQRTPSPNPVASPTPSPDDLATPPYSRPTAMLSSTATETADAATHRTVSSVQAQAKKPAAPYTTFSQLPFVPPVPSSVLSSAWTIPPLYTDVVARSPSPPSTMLSDNPSFTVSGDVDPSAATSATPAPSADLPLLSPVSLLGGPALRGNGPPGLFFVSRGNTLTGIVTSDGKSVIKRPVIWFPEKPTKPTDPEEMPLRIEILVVGGTKTVVVKVSPTDVTAIAVEGLTTTNPFSPPVLASPSFPTPSIQFLATHSASQQLFFAQSVGQSWTVQIHNVSKNTDLLLAEKIPKVSGAVIAVRSASATPKKKKEPRAAKASPVKSAAPTAQDEQQAERDRAGLRSSSRIRSNALDAKEKEIEKQRLAEMPNEDVEYWESGGRMRTEKGYAPEKLGKRLYNPKQFGHIPGVPVGTHFASRMEASQAAVHAPVVAGISGRPDIGCWSIAVSGGYEDDVDLGYRLTFTGSGGRDLKGTVKNPKNLRTAPQTADQTWDKLNAALKRSVETKKHIRVLRGFKGKSPFAPLEGYRYDGLYVATKAWKDVGASGFKVCRVSLIRVPGQPKLPIQPGREHEVEKLQMMEKAAKIAEEPGEESSPTAEDSELSEGSDVHAEDDESSPTTPEPTEDVEIKLEEREGTKRSADEEEELDETGSLKRARLD